MYSKTAISACLRGVPRVSPDQFGLDGFEERFNGGVVVTITLTTHGYLEAVLAQDLLIIVRTILAATICVMDAVFGWRTECDCHLQCPDSKVAFHPVANGPADHAPIVQVEDDGKIQPSLTGPDIGNVPPAHF